jgi:beta-lactamase regulating signal transducer with metallopeptidase domain
MSLLLWLASQLFLHNLLTALTVFLTKGLILFGLAYVATRFFPSLSAEHKHSIWFLIVLGLVVLPVGRLFVPLVPITLHYSNPHSLSRLLALPVSFTERVGSIIDASSANVGSSGVSAPRLFLLLPAGLWLAGLVIFILRYMGGRISLSRLAVVQADSQLLRLSLVELAGRMRIKREVSVVYCSRCAIPLTYGLLHPRIMLPSASRGWPAERLRAVVVHELAHIKRADWLCNTVTYFVCAFLWFNPLAWLAREYMLREAEICCDRSVLISGMKATEYVSAMVGIARDAKGQFLLPGAYGIIGTKSLLRERIVRVLDLGRRPSTLGRTGKPLLLCFSLLLLLFATTYSLRAGGKLHAPTTHFIAAALFGTPQDVQAAIDKGADVNARDMSGQTALIWAATDNKNPAVIAALLKAGADTEVWDSVFGGTALLWAAMYNQNPAVITLLLKGGAHINARNHFNGTTALIKAAMYNQNPEVISTLLKAGADAKVKDNAGRTAFYYAQGRAFLEGTDAYRQLQEASR